MKLSISLLRISLTICATIHCFKPHKQSIAIYFRWSYFVVKLNCSIKEQVRFRDGLSLILSSPSRARAYTFWPGLDRALLNTIQILPSPMVLYSKFLRKSLPELLNIRLGRARALNLFTSSLKSGSDPALVRFQKTLIWKCTEGSIYFLDIYWWFTILM